MDFFSQNYQEARERFVGAAKAAGARCERLKISPQGPEGEELSIDIAVVGDIKADKIFLHTSGIHGVEGFAGSAVQLAAMSQDLQERRGMGIVLVHILNPFGMAWLRRVNEKNVDLNRNFLVSGGAYCGTGEAYCKLDPFLNSPSGEHWYWPQLLYYLSRMGVQAFKEAVVQGQYDFPLGLFFGGQALQEGPRLYRSWLDKNLKSPKTAIALDVHTGLGKFGQEVIFCKTNQPVPDIGKEITSVKDPVGYTVRGGLETLTGEIFQASRWSHFTQEFGTHPKSKILQAMRNENFHFREHQAIGAPNLRLKRMMSPDNKAWQQTVVEQGVETLTGAINWLESQ